MSDDMQNPFDDEPIKDILIDEDDDGAQRIVINGKAVLDEITTVQPTLEEVAKELTRKHSDRAKRRLLRDFEYSEETRRLLKAHRARQTVNEDLEKHQRLIENPPAYFLDNWLRLIVSKKSYERIYSQMIIDTREEYFEALAAKRTTKARWILARCYLSAAWAWLLMVPTSVSVAIFKTLSGS